MRIIVELLSRAEMVLSAYLYGEEHLYGAAIYRVVNIVYLSEICLRLVCYSLLPLSFFLCASLTFNFILAVISGVMLVMFNKYVWTPRAALTYFIMIECCYLNT